MTREEIYVGVRDCVAAVRDIPPETIRPEQRIIGDLGADSLDLLDLTFQLEQRFAVAISPRGIEQRAKAALDGSALEIDGVYTPEALGEIRKALPEVPDAELADGLTVAALPRCFRVATFVNVVARLLEENEKNG